MDGKRLVTCYWLNDVILSKKLFAPQTAMHIPVAFKDKLSRCRRMVSIRETKNNIYYTVPDKYLSGTSTLS